MSEEQFAFSVYAISTAAAVYSLLCRMHMMSKDTPRAVRLQHVCLLAGLVFGFVIPGPIGRVCLPVSVVAYLAFSMARWRFGAPADLASKPGEFDDKPHHHAEAA